MRRYIKLTYTICFLIVMTAILSTTFLMFRSAKLADIEESLKMVATAIQVSEIPQNINLQQYTKDLASTNKNLRVTIIDKDGHVLGDSQVDILSMDNHLNRNEIINAIKTGFGEETRLSETTGIQTIYTAIKVNDSRIVRLSYPLIATYDFPKAMLIILIIISIVMGVFINNFANKFSKKLLSPLEDISKLLETKEEMDTSSRPKYKSFKEIDSILKHIDYLIRKLHYDFAEMEKTQQMRTDFVANASHELKSPLTSIKGFADLISSGLISDKEKQNDYLKRIIKESDRLLVIINDILRLSEAESVKVNPLELKVVSLDQVAIDVIKSLEGLRVQKNIVIFVTGQGSILAMKKDIWELIYNLVNNGIRYGKERGFIEIKIEETERKTTLTVQDNGIGIAQEHLPRIFERFYRADTSRSRKNGGTGLGLSIVRNIAAKYGASLTVESIIGHGTTFKIEFYHLT